MRDKLYFELFNGLWENYCVIYIWDKIADLFHTSSLRQRLPKSVL